MKATMFAALAAGLFALAGCGGETIDLPRETQTVGGMTIYIGVVPADLVRDHPTTAGDPKALHGGATKYGSSHHVVVALFDAKSGARITDARILAGVSNHMAEPIPSTALEPMEIEGAMTYGNFFQMPGNSDYRIRLEIQRPHDAAPVRADFAYGHPAD